MLVNWASLMAQMAKNLPAMQDTWVQTLDWEDPPEKGEATHFSIPCLENFMGSAAWWAIVMGSERVRHV